MHIIITTGITTGLSLAVLLSAPVLSAPLLESIAQADSLQSTDTPPPSSLRDRAEISGLRVDRFIGKIALAKATEEKWRQAIQANPNSAEAHRELANALSDLGRYRDAEAIYQRAIQLDSTDEAAYAAYGQFLAYRGRMADRVLLFEQMVKALPGSAIAYGQLASSLEAASVADWPDKETKIEAVYRAAIAAQPDDISLYLFFADWLDRNEREGEAEALYQSALAQFPDNPKLYESFGSYLRSQGQLEKAESLYAQAVERDLTNESIYMQLGDTLIRQGDYAAAETAYQEAISLSQTGIAYVKLANLLNYVGREDEIIPLLQQAIQQLPTERHLYDIAGELLENNGRIDDAIAVRRRELARLGLDLESVDGLANLLLEKQQYAEVVDLYEQLGSIYSLDSNRLERWQTALREMGRASEAETLKGDLQARLAADREARYREAVALSPESGYFYAELGDVLSEQGKIAAAAAAYQEALRLEHNPLETNTKLGRLYFEQGEFALAETTYRAAIAFYPEKDRELFEPKLARLYGYLAELYQVTGHSEAAIAFYQKVLEIDPDRPDIAEKVTELQARPLESQPASSVEASDNEADINRR